MSEHGRGSDMFDADGRMMGFSARVKPEGLQIVHIMELVFRCCLCSKALMLLYEHLILKLRVKVFY